MSRIGRRPIDIPEGVTVLTEGQLITATGGQGRLQTLVPAVLGLEVKDGRLLVNSKSLSRKNKALWGLYRNILANMVSGVLRGFRKELELSGLGFKVKKDGEEIVLSLGFSHPVRFKAPAGVIFEVEGENRIIITGIDRSAVGQAAAKIKSLKRPEPYKGKGIKYLGEIVRRKAGKAGKVGAGLGAK